MPNATVKQYQNLFDIAVLNCGDVTAVFALANLNGKSLTDELLPGQLLQTADVVSAKAVQQLAAKKAKPASASPQSQTESTSNGIWKINYNNAAPKSVLVAENQTLMDIAVLISGDVVSLFDLANKNGRSITDVLASGEELQLVDVADADIVAGLKSKNARPATGSATITGGVKPEGIGYWYIENDFKVS